MEREEEESFNALSLPEINERVLFYLPLPDLLSQCSSSQENRELCNSRRFWAEKLRREGLSLLEDGENIKEWTIIYKNSLLARDVADLEMERLPCYLSISAVQNINLLLVGSVSREKISPYYFSNRLWKTRNNINQETLELKGKQKKDWLAVYKGISRGDPYMVSLLKEPFRFRVSHLVEVPIPPGDEEYNPERPQDNYYKMVQIVLEELLSPSQTRELLYRLVYFNVDYSHKVVN